VSKNIIKSSIWFN